MSKSIKLIKLLNKPLTEQFTEEELSFLKKNVDFKSWVIHYVIYRKESSKNLNIGLCVDYMRHNPRGRKPGHYGMDVIYTRELNNKEIMWELKNYGSCNRRFNIEWFSSVLEIIKMDEMYGVTTPKTFIDKCVELGYNKGFQLNLEFQ